MKLENPAVHATTLEHFWMPFTANRAFKAAPRLLARAEGMYYWTPDGLEVLDGTAGLWCVNAGHARRPIVEAVQKQAATMDYAPPFSMAGKNFNSLNPCSQAISASDTVAMPGR